MKHRLISPHNHCNKDTKKIFQNKNNPEEVKNKDIMSETADHRYYYRRQPWVPANSSTKRCNKRSTTNKIRISARTIRKLCIYSQAPPISITNVFFSICYRLTFIGLFLKFNFVDDWSIETAVSLSSTKYFAFAFSISPSFSRQRAASTHHSPQNGFWNIVPTHHIFSKKLVREGEDCFTEDEENVRSSKKGSTATLDGNATAPNITFYPGQYRTKPIIDQEGRQWRSAIELGRLRRDGLTMERSPELFVPFLDGGDVNSDDKEGVSSKKEQQKQQQQRKPWEATMRQHTMMLRDMERGPAENQKKGRFVTDEERWFQKYDALVRFHDRYGHTNVPFHTPDRTRRQQQSRMQQISVTDLPYLSTSSGKSSPVITPSQSTTKYKKNYLEELEEMLVAVQDDDNFDENEETDESQMLFNEILFNEQEDTLQQYKNIDPNNYNVTNHNSSTIKNNKSNINSNNNNNREKYPTFYLNDEFMEPYTRMELGYWVAQQRYNYRAYNGTRMTEQRVEFLNALNFTWDVKGAKWESRYMELVDYWEQNGENCLDSITQDCPLGRWIYKQRWYDRCMKRGDMIDLGCVPVEAFRKENLSSAGKSGETNLNTDTFAPTSIEEMTKKSSVEDFVIDLPGGGRMYKGKLISPLTPKRRALLDKIGFVWNHWDAVYERNFQQLLDFQKEYGTTRVPPTKYPTLGKWVRKHRAEWRKLQQANVNNDESGNHRTFTEISSFLTPERIKRLDGIGFEWVVRKYTWDDHFRHLLDYKSINGHVNVPQSYDDPVRHPKLGSWLSTQRRAGRNYRDSVLSGNKNETKNAKYSKHMDKIRFEKLQSAGVIWDPNLVKFLHRTQELYMYWEENGKTDKISAKTHGSLRTWVNSMKKEFKKYLKEGCDGCALDEDRIALLDGIGFRDVLQ